MITRSTRFGIAIAAAAALLSGCGGSSSNSDNGVKAASVADIATKVTTAINSQKGVELTGDSTISSQKATLDLKADLSSGAVKGMTGTIKLASGGTILIVLVNNHFYMTLDAQSAGILGGGSSAAAAALANKCIDLGDITQASNPLASSGGGLGSLTNGTLGDSLFKGKTYNKGTVTQINGVEVQPLTDATGSELDIQTTGDALPVRFIDKSSSGGTLTISNWGVAANASAPSDCVSLQQLIQSSLGAPSPGDTSGASPSPAVSPTP